jgi:hypothetical protein
MDTDHARDEDLAVLRAVAWDEPPWGWEAVRAFEADNRIMLPEPYRTFVAEIGDGLGYYPVTLGRPPRDLRRHQRARDLARPFPLTEAWIWENDPRPELPESYREAVSCHGSLVVSYEGCGMNWRLIVTGPHRGHMWDFGGEGVQPWGAEFGYTTGASGFAGWVKHKADGKWWWDAG